MNFPDLSPQRKRRLEGIRDAHGKPPRGDRGIMPIPTDELWLSYDGSALYLDNQWMLFW